MNSQILQDKVSKQQEADIENQFNEIPIQDIEDNKDPRLKQEYEEEKEGENQQNKDEDQVIEENQIIFSPQTEQMYEKIQIQTTANEKSDQVKLSCERSQSTKLTYSVTSPDGYKKSVKVNCKFCNKKVNTNINKKVGPQTILAMFILLICSFGFICISCLPLLMNDCKDTVHQCPECKKNIGKTAFRILD